ncbi:DEAD/DEAH box helicase [Deinococcus rubellus]|uniref:DEAD/DEAH box helicase n=1 Tax=Deinococcus rubellus TaxID=1889240 RepID=UPI0031E769E4
MNDVLSIQQRLERIYGMYVESAFPLRYPALAAERRVLLSQKGMLAQPPLIEPVPIYASSGKTLDDAAAALPAEYQGLANLAGPLFPDGRTLYQHQWDALQASLVDRKDVVVTTGTGSGKTEAFMLPLLAALSAESREWALPKPPPANREWWRDKGERVSQWGHVTRPHALRGLILYPLNALVEDQLRRLRSVLDSPGVTGWQNRKRGGNRVTYGRYTSMAPLPGAPEPKKVERLRDRLKEREAEWKAVRNTLQARGDGSEYHFPRPESGELWSRWDAQDSPPDLLITNYSMLNIMLMRALEAGIFAQTREWLAADPRRSFYLVVDELHTYRGTPGTEVSYILRLLFQRLGLTPDSPQLRILATSASLDSSEGSKRFLREFFGRSEDCFEVIGTPQVTPSRGADLSAHTAAFARFAAASPAEALDSGATAVSESAQDELSQSLGTSTSGMSAAERLADALSLQGLPDALRAACWDEKTGVRATSSPVLAEKMFGDAEAIQPLRGVLLALATAKLNSSHPNAGQNLQPMRGHLFFQNVQNLWACVNPACDGDVKRDASLPTPQIGSLHGSHRLTCDCGSRILDLLVCEVCGEVYLGAHRKKSQTEHLLSADRSDLEGVPDQLDSRTYGRYAVLWPVKDHAEHKIETYEWQKRGRRWQPQYLERPTGRLLSTREVGKVSADDDLQPVWAYTIAASQDGEADRESAFPPVCPACDTDYRRRDIFPTPLRHHRTGFQKSAQVLASTLMREVDAKSRKLVVFSDSRQDAARLAAGMERDHFRDMVRVALLGALRDSGHELEAAVRVNLNHPGQTGAALERLRDINPHLAAQAAHPLQPGDEQWATAFAGRSTAAALFPVWLMGAPLSSNQEAEILHLLAQYPARIPLAELREGVFSRLLSQGICPGGNSMASLFYEQGNDKQTPWHRAFRWAKDGVQVRSAPPEAKAHAANLSALLLTEMMLVLFTHQVRTLESIGQGWVSAPLTGQSVAVQEVTDALIRFLAVKRRYANSDFVEPGSSDALHGGIKKYLATVDQDEEQMRQRLLASDYAERSSTGLIVRADNLVLIGDGRAQGARSYRCQKCRAHYLHAAGGKCVHCHGTVKEETNTRSDELELDYYAYLARESSPSFRLNAEELTGQTDSESRSRRQRHFQDVFLEGEEARPEGIDLLSVTTTMEAGVDIGSLNAVMMSNMPPRRFNYQQRVGRAGRRGASLSLAVTLCRGRTHDLYYYAHTEAMTGDAPPPPYVDTSSLPIFRRVLNKEVLRRAIGAAQPISTDSVHGEFGSVNEWLGQPEEVRHDKKQSSEILDRQARLSAFLTDPLHQRETAELAQQLAAHTRLEFKQVQAALDELQTLPQRITEIAQDFRLIQEQLSERLAHAGLLPMFGFPTRTRVMYLDPLTQISGQNFPPRNVVDRDLDLAISAFAPGAEVVRDKRVHTSVGVVNLRPSPHGSAKTSAGLFPPLGEDNPRPLGVCSYCRAVHETEELAGMAGDTVSCPTCGTESLRVLDAREPRHFYTDGAVKDYNGFFEIRGFSTRPTLAMMHGEVSAAVGNAALCSTSSGQQNEILTFNDYGGRGGFDFAPDPMRVLGGAYRADLEIKGRAQRTAGSKRIALLSRRRTDTLGIALRQWPAHHYAPPETVEGRAAWYSLAYALRDAAAVMLDIEGGELEGGMFVGGGQGQAEASAFLSDRLENGAGYANFLGQPQEFRQLLGHLNTDLRRAWTDHQNTCDASCARCLRDYTNLAFHPILDWRLALDMGALLNRPEALPLLESHWATLFESETSPIQSSLRQLMFVPARFDTPLPVFVGQGKYKGKVVILRHPLWSEDHPSVLKALEKAAPHAQEAPKIVSPFMLLRRPSDAL